MAENERPDGRPPARGEGGEGRSRFGAGAQGGRGPGGPPGRGPRRSGGRYVPRRKVCAFCVDNVGEVDYKDIARLRRHLSERGKIEPRRKLGTCAKHQRSLTVAIKRARHVALLPFTTSAR
jgi:small subunit ribosomal protein S18